MSSFKGIRVLSLECYSMPVLLWNGCPCPQFFSLDFNLCWGVFWSSLVSVVLVSKKPTALSEPVGCPRVGLSLLPVLKG